MESDRRKGERRTGCDRRRVPRGGRRAADHSEKQLLVLVIAAAGGYRARVVRALTIAGLAVAECEPDEALQPVYSLVPDVVLAEVSQAIQLRGRLPAGRSGRIPIVDLVGDDDESLRAQIRQAAAARDRRL